MTNWKYIQLLAREDRFIREFRYLYDLAVEHGCDTETVESCLLNAVEAWERKHPRLSALYKGRAA